MPVRYNKLVRLPCKGGCAGWRSPRPRFDEFRRQWYKETWQSGSACSLRFSRRSSWQRASAAHHRLRNRRRRRPLPRPRPPRHRLRRPPGPPGSRPPAHRGRGATARQGAAAHHRVPGRFSPFDSRDEPRAHPRERLLAHGPRARQPFHAGGLQDRSPRERRDGERRV